MSPHSTSQTSLQCTSTGRVRFPCSPAWPPHAARPRHLRPPLLTGTAPDPGGPARTWVAVCSLFTSAAIQRRPRRPASACPSAAKGDFYGPAV